MNSHQDSLIDPGKDDSKQWWASKTLWATIITAILPLVPPLTPLIAANPELWSVGLSTIFAAFRIKTDSPVRFRK